MIRLILDTSRQVTEDEYKRTYRTFDLDNPKLEHLLTKCGYEVCGSEVVEEKENLGTKA